MRPAPPQYAGGKVDVNARRFRVVARRGSSTFGISSGQFLEDEFRMESLELEMVFHDDDTLSYDEMTGIRIKGKEGIFEHMDKETLKREK